VRRTEVGEVELDAKVGDAAAQHVDDAPPVELVDQPLAEHRLRLVGAAVTLDELVPGFRLGGADEGEGLGGVEGVVAVVGGGVARVPAVLEEVALDGVLEVDFGVGGGHQAAAAGSISPGQRYGDCRALRPSSSRWCSPKTMLGSRSMGKRKGNQRDTAFSLFDDAEFVERFYSRRHTFDRTFRRRVEREAKARGIRNVQRRGG